MSSFAENLFVDAAACGDLEEVKSLLASTEPLLSSDIINRPDKDGKSAFHYACLNDDANLLKILLADPRVDVLQTSRSGDTGVHMAALYSSLEALSLLHADGRVSLNAKNKYGETPLHLCAGSGDKTASKTAALLLSMGASLTVTDKWKRGPIDVSHDNAENPIVATFTEYLNDRTRCTQEDFDTVSAITAAYKSESTRSIESTTGEQAEADIKRNKAAAMSLFGQLGDPAAAGTGIAGLSLGGVKLKKTTTVVKTMFRADEGTVKGGGSSAGTASQDPRKALSKLIDFPGDLEEIRKHLDDEVGVNPAGADSYGLTALHKFASWNKTDYLDLLIPKLSQLDLEAKCPEGKTALHYSVEMASVAAVKALVAAGVSLDARDGKGHTVAEILDAAPPSGVIDRLKIAIASGK